VTKNLFSQWFLQFIRLVLSFITTVFVARVLGPEGYGVATSIFVFSNLFSFIVDLGFSGSIVRYVSVYSGSGKKCTHIIAGFLVYRVLVGSLLAITFYVLAPYFASIVNASKYVAAYQLFSTSIFLSSVYGALRAYLYGIERIDLASLYYSIGFVIGNISSFILVLSGFGVLGYILGFIISDITQFFIHVLTLRNLISKCVKVNLNEALSGLKTILPLSLALLTSKLMDFLYNWFDRALVLGLLGTYSLGLYSIALRFASVFDIMRQSVSTALTPYYGNLYGANGIEALRPRVKRSSKLMSLTYIPLTLAIASLTPILIPLIYGGKFVSSWPIAYIHLTYLALTSFTVAYGGIPLVTEARKEIIMSTGIKALSSIALELLFVIVGLEALGVILGRNVGAFLAFMYLYLALFSKLKLDFDKKSHLLGALIGIVISTLLVLPTFMMKIQFWYLILPFALTIYPALLKIFKPIDYTDIKLLREALGTRFNRIVDIIEDLVAR